MTSDGQSNIRVQVHWHEQTVFAGEEVRCTITFKNAARDSKRQKSSQQGATHHDRQKLLSGLKSPLSSRNRAAGSLSASSSANSMRGHRRSALSLSIPSTSSHTRSATVQWPQSAGIGPDGRSGHSHKRSLSIVSIGSTTAADDAIQRSERQHIPHRAHNRATSLQIFSKAQATGLPTSHSDLLSSRQSSSPLYNASYPPDRFGRLSAGSTAPTTPPLPPGRRRSPRASPNAMPDFHFPAAPPTEHDKIDMTTSSPQLRANDIKRDAVASPAARVLSSTGVAGGTPRSSGEFYSMSNHSSETLASEYPSQKAVRNTGQPPHLRRSSGLSSPNQNPESLMMGFAQVQGSFLLDGSLVSLSPFEQVKKKAAVGGRGGGVVGLESQKRDSGLLRGLGWNSISSSLGDFLGGNELSSIKEMRGAANSKSVPLLTTPQSILFVDLQLPPGESRSYEYSFRLPRGLPPSHKGKTIKIFYNLVIGTQRAGGVKEQQVKSVEVPFRVLGGVNSQGEILGHDLMNPYIILRDEAKVTPVGKGSKSKNTQTEQGDPQAVNEFLAYVDDLVAQQQEQHSGNLLSPTESVGKRRPSTFEESASTARDAIHLAIMKSNMASEGQSQNKFEIARNGQKVGTVMLPRPAYRLGEVVTMVIDFANAQIPCLAVHATLETTEKIDPSFAVRSESSVQRVTRKVYAASSEVTMYSRRVVFTPTIPITATPEFVTSGVSFDWKIRVEFVVPSQGNDEVSEGNTSYPLLEQISEDVKGGLVLVAAENLSCESFDVSVPIRVYGAVGKGLERLEYDEAVEDGLAV